MTEQRSGWKRFSGAVANTKFIMWWSIGWGIAIMALSPVVNLITPFLNPDYANQWTPDIYWRLVMYWHGGIFIPWITALAALVCTIFGLDRMRGWSGKLIRDSVFFGGFVAVPLAGIAGILDVYESFAMGIPLWTQIFAFLIGDEIAIALIVALVNKPRAAGTGYFKAGLPFYAVLVSVSAALISAMMGHVGGWITWFGPSPSIVPQYINSTMYPVLGYYNDSAVIMFTENAVGSHSHLMLPALMAGVVALAASFYGFGSWTRSQKLVGGLGFGAMILGLLGAIVIYVISGVGNFQTPSLFVSGPGGVNGIAEDDVITGIIGGASVFLLAALLMHARGTVTEGGRRLLSEPLFLSVVVAWVMIILVIPITGYYVEFNHSFYGAGGAAFDDAFTRFHQDFGFFLLPPLVTVALAVGAFGVPSRPKRIIGLSFLLGEVFAFVFGELYTMSTVTDTASSVGAVYTVLPISTLTLDLAVLGGVVMALGGLFAALRIGRVPPPFAAASSAPEQTKS